METTADLEKSAPAETLEPMTPGSDMIDSKAERRLVMKLDMRVYPILFIMYMMSFLDRINISNAKIQGMTKSLDLSGNHFNIALFVYFISYVVFEVPSNIVIHYVRPSYWIGSLMTIWGIINMCMAFVKTWQALAGMRFLLGIFEAGLLPGIIYLTSMYYTRYEFQKRMNIFFCSTMLGGAIGGLLAYAIADLGGKHGYGAWQWIFIIEGSITAFIGLCSIFLIVDWPEQAKFLNDEEKELIRRRLAIDGSSTVARMDTLNSFAKKTIFSDWKIYCGAFMYFGLGCTGLAVTYFLPTILTEFGWAGRHAQVMTIPIYAVAVVYMVIISWLSDRFHHRYGFIMLSAIIACVGYIMLLCQGNMSTGVKFFATFLVSTGGNGANPIVLTWLTNNTSGHWKRAFASSMQVMIGNCVGLVASNIYETTQAPKYPTGYGVSLGLTIFGMGMSTLMYFGCKAENKKRDAGGRDYRLSLPEEDLKNMGDDHPSFRFTL